MSSVTDRPEGPSAEIVSPGTGVLMNEAGGSSPILESSLCCGSQDMELENNNAVVLLCVQANYRDPSQLGPQEQSSLVTFIPTQKIYREKWPEEEGRREGVSCLQKCQKSWKLSVQHPRKREKKTSLTAKRQALEK